MEKQTISKYPEEIHRTFPENTDLENWVAAEEFYGCYIKNERPFKREIYWNLYFAEMNSKAYPGEKTDLENYIIGKAQTKLYFLHQKISLLSHDYGYKQKGWQYLKSFIEECLNLVSFYYTSPAYEESLHTEYEEIFFNFIKAIGEASDYVDKG